MKTFQASSPPSPAVPKESEQGSALDYFFENQGESYDEHMRQKYGTTQSSESQGLVEERGQGSGLPVSSQQDQEQEDQEEENLEEEIDEQAPEPDEQEEKDIKLAKQFSLQGLHDTQPRDGGSASSIQGPRDPWEELHATLKEQTKLSEELNRIIERQRSGVRLKRML